jgi:hypothetical protein
MAGKTNAPVKLPSSTNFWDVLKWIVICSFIIVIIIIILANVLPVKKSSPSTSTVVDPCKLTCSGKDLDSAKQFYEKTSNFGKMFTMTPNYGVVVDENTCDINYTYAPIPGVSTGSGGVDYRRFTYSPGCNKNAIDFGSEHSGVTAASPKPSS